MPTTPPRLCSRGRHLVQGRGPCPSCAPDRERLRGTRQARGYDERWIHLRARHAAAFPLCARCEARGRVRPMADVDHVVPFDGLDDPRRLDPTNLQSLCRSCHLEKQREDHGRG